MRSTRARIPRFVTRGSEQHTPDFLRLYTLFMLLSFGLLTHRTAHRAASPVTSCLSATRKQSLQHLSEKSLAGPSPARGPETGLEEINGDLLEGLLARFEAGKWRICLSSGSPALIAHAPTPLIFRSTSTLRVCGADRNAPRCCSMMSSALLTSPGDGYAILEGNLTLWV